jgi:hypothetical protein
MFVACKLPAGMIVRHKECEVLLLGANNGLDATILPANGAAPDGATRSGGWGVTEVSGDDATALKDWIDVTGKGDGPVAAGMIFTAASRRELDAEVGKRSRSGLEGLDPNRDLPATVEAAKKD